MQCSQSVNGGKNPRLVKPVLPLLFCFILLTHEGSHWKVYWEFQPSYDIFRRWCQELFIPQVPCTPGLHCPTRPNFLCNPVVIESICYCTRANQLKNESNTTGGLIKIRNGNCHLCINTEPTTVIGRPNKSNPPVVLFPFFSRFVLLR